MVPQIEYVFQMINKAYIGRLSVMLLPLRDLTNRNKPMRIIHQQKDCGTAQASLKNREYTELPASKGSTQLHKRAVSRVAGIWFIYKLGVSVELQLSGFYPLQK